MIPEWKFLSETYWTPDVNDLIARGVPHHEIPKMRRLAIMVAWNQTDFHEFINEYGIDCKIDESGEYFVVTGEPEAIALKLWLDTRDKHGSHVNASSWTHHLVRMA